MIKKTLIFFTLTTIYLILAAISNAQYGQYNPPPPTQSILIDKWVAKPTGQTKGGVTDYEYVDNLSPSDPRFSAQQFVMFRLKVKNTSNVTIYNVTVKDFVPSYLYPVEGPGNFDSNSRTVVFNAGDFAPDEEKWYYLKMQIVPVNQMPNDKGLFCVVNKAQAYNDKVSDDDTAQLCIEKQVSIPPGKPVPQAGPEMGVLLMTGQIGLLALGLKIKSYYHNPNSK